MTDYKPQIGDTVRWCVTTTAGTELIKVGKIARINSEGVAYSADNNALYAPGCPERTTLLRSAKPKWGAVFGTNEKNPALIYLPGFAGDKLPWLSTGGYWLPDEDAWTRIRERGHRLLTGEHLDSTN